MIEYIDGAQGQLIFLAAGDEPLFTEVGPQLDAMGKASFYLGQTGKGTEMKLVVNMVRATLLALTNTGFGVTRQFLSTPPYQIIIAYTNIDRVSCRSWPA